MRKASWQSEYSNRIESYHIIYVVVKCELIATKYARPTENMQIHYLTGPYWTEAIRGSRTLTEWEDLSTEKYLLDKKCLAIGEWCKSFM